MKFIPLDEISEDSSLEVQSADKQLKTDLQGARQIGAICLGNDCLFIKKVLKTYYIPYSKITRAYRRVFLVPAKMCCASGNLEVQSVVIETAAKGEVANVNLPGERAVEILLQELKSRAPSAEYVCPEKPIIRTPGKSEKSQQAHKSKQSKGEVV